MAASLLTKFQQQCSTSTLLDDINDYTCPICLEVYEKPRRITCGHMFCKSCLANYDDILSPACAVCRQGFEISSSKKASDVEKTINSSSAVCRGCSQKVPLSKLRFHNSVCPQLTDRTKDIPADSSDGAGGAEGVAMCAPNRSTFRCPYCGLQNLDTHTFVKHCSESHRSHPGSVVCPICASMPWGDPTQKSSNFIAHLSLRHKFEYGFVVDFELNDDEALEKALKTSLEEQ